MQTPQYFLDMADECFALVQAAREQANRLERMAHDFMARAVELDTSRDRAGKPDSTT